MTLKWRKNSNGKVVSAGYRFLLDGVWYAKQGYETLEVARKAEHNKREEFERERQARMSGTVSCLDLTNKYLDHVKARMVYNTFRDKKRCYQAFVAHVGSDTPTTDIQKHDITSYLDPIAIQDQEEGTKKANRQLRNLKACFNWGWQEGLLGKGADNPCRGIPDYTEERYEPRIPPNEHLAMVYLKMNQDQRDFCDTIRFTMSRKVEVKRLTWNDINLEKRVAVFWTKKRRGQGWKSMPKPINNKLHEILTRRYKKRRKDDPRVFYFTDKELRFLEYICRELEIPIFGFHALRHRAASILNDSGKASMKEIQLLLGHDRQTTTETYLHHVSATLQFASEILDADDLEKQQVDEEAKEEDEKDI